MIENLNCSSQVVSDHMMNLLPEIEGKLPEDKEKILAVIERFQSMTPEERDIYKLGRRLGLFDKLDDINDISRREEVGSIMGRIDRNKEGAFDEIVFNLMERYV